MLSTAVRMTPSVAVADQSTFGGFIVLTDTKGLYHTLRVPFYGWKGQYQKLNPIVDLSIGM